MATGQASAAVQGGEAASPYCLVSASYILGNSTGMEAGSAELLHPLPQQVGEEWLQPWLCPHNMAGGEVLLAHWRVYAASFVDPEQGTHRNHG